MFGRRARGSAIGADDGARGWAIFPLVRRKIPSPAREARRRASAATRTLPARAREPCTFPITLNGVCEWCVCVQHQRGMRSGHGRGYKGFARDGASAEAVRRNLIAWLITHGHAVMKFTSE